MANRVRVRRDRPSALSWALALAVTMLAVYLITLSARPKDVNAAETSARGERVTRELTLEGMTMYFADLGCHGQPGDARIQAAALTERGAAGVVWTDVAGSHVLGAAYPLEADAERIARQLAQKEALEAGVLALSAQPVPLRVTAPEADVEAIEGADRVLRVQLNQIASMALQLDRGELNAASARTLAAVSASELDGARRALAAVPGADQSGLCAGLMEQLDGLSSALRSLAKGREGGAALSGRLRCCHVSGVLRLLAFLKDTAATVNF